MSEDNVQPEMKTLSPEMKTFIDNYNRENEQDNVRYPLKDMFEQIKSDLDTIYDAITSHQYFFRGDTDKMREMRESVRNLNELLNKCLTISKKQRGSSKNCLNYSPADLFLAKTARDKLQKIMPGLKETRAEVEKYMMEKFNISKDVQWTSGDFDESKIYGWDDQAKEIIKSLVKENKEGLNVVGIVGMFGTGKTTLAQKIFVSDEVMDHFPLRLWVWVSEKCDREELLRRMLDNLGVEEDHIEDMLKVDPKLKKVGVLLFLVHLELLRKRYLIVFDDVVKVEEPWHCELDKEPPEDKEWTGRLAYGLPKGDGSAIIITSSKEDDARKMVGAGDIFTPERLLKEDGWTLFKSSFEEVTGKPFEDTNLENLWKEITHKCDGLPIALKAAGKSMAEAVIQKEKEKVQAEKQKEEEAIKAESSDQSNA